MFLLVEALDDSFIVWVPPCKIIQNVFSCFPDWSAEFIFCFFALFPRKISAVFSPGGDLPVSYFSIFFSKCKQFSFICVNRMFNNKMNYSEHEIIKNNFFKNNVYMKITKWTPTLKCVCTCAMFLIRPCRQVQQSRDSHKRIILLVRRRQEILETKSCTRSGLNIRPALQRRSASISAKFLLEL